MLSRAAFINCLDQLQSALVPMSQSARRTQHRASRLQAVLEALQTLHPTAKPLGLIKNLTAEVNEWLREKRNDHGVSEDTVSRALKVYQPPRPQD